MQVLGLTFILGAACFITYQDFKYRLISVYAILLFLSGHLLVEGDKVRFLTATIVGNISFLFLLILSLKLYITFRHGLKAVLINNFIGMGDILLLAVCCICYSLYNYIFYIVVSCVSAIVYWLAVQRFHRLSKRGIPFAGIMAAVQCVVLFLNYHQIQNLVTVDFIFLSDLFVL